MRFLAAILLLVAMGMISCRKGNSSSNNNVVTANYMIIGSAGGFLNITKCTYYIISGGQLKADTNVNSSNIPTDVRQFNFSTVLPTSKYDSVKDLQNLIPPELLGKNGEEIGAIVPDVGYTDVRTSINGIFYQWTIESDQSKSSAAVQQFVDSVRLIFQ